MLKCKSFSAPTVYELECKVNNFLFTHHIAEVISISHAIDNEEYSDKIYSALLIYKEA